MEGDGMPFISDTGKTNAVVVWVKRQGKVGSTKTKRQVRAHFFHLDELP